MSDLEECTTIPEVIDIFESTDGDEDFNTNVVYRIAEIAAEEDDDLNNTLEYRNLMLDATDYCDNITVEIHEAIDALDEAHDAEEWDQMTWDAVADWESDEAMADAAAEVDDVNGLLTEFKGFLHDMGESVVGLHGSDFDFGFSDVMSESFFGDFWGSEMNMDKIVQGRSQMLLLLEQIGQIDERFTKNLDITEDQIQEQVDTVWQEHAN